MDIVGHTRAKAGLTLALVAICLGSVTGLATPAPSGAAGPAGPDSCLDGFVWRDAGPNDHVCVTPARRDRAAEDNELADSRRNPNGGEWGPDTCLEGFIWREAFPGDHVCVTPARFDQVQEENARGPGLRALDIFSDTVELPRVDRPTGFVDARVTVDLNPNGAFSLHGWAQGTTLAANNYSVACVVPLTNGDALAISAKGEVGGAAGDQFDDIDVPGTSARVANNWTRIARSADAECALDASLDVERLFNRLKTIVQIAGTIIKLVA
jgi:hypothetical protein